jgi:hypothetical protein
MAGLANALRLPAAGESQTIMTTLAGKFRRGIEIAVVSGPPAGQQDGRDSPAGLIMLGPPR